MRLHHQFEWDSVKAEKNREKHRGVTFDDAAAVLGDDEGEAYQLTEHDDAHSDIEDRYITIGTHPSDRRIILTIAWTDRSTADGPITRIISARLASRRERAKHAKKISEP